MKITILIGDPLSTLPIYATYLRYNYILYSTVSLFYATINNASLDAS